MTGQAPIRTLFAYALLLDEHGEEMHKSKGNSIPFDEAAEHIGADVMRWMYASANPASNLRFGYGPGHEVVRRFFLPLWNTYGFLVTYARLDGWTPSDADGVDGARTLLDRWILSRLDALVEEVGSALDEYDAQRATRAIEAFVDDLSNWYVRRNRRRFWKGELDADKRAAYATLHEVLTTVARLLAPIIPHLADAIWDNLVAAVDPRRPGQRAPGRLSHAPRRPARPVRRGRRGAGAPHRRPRSHGPGRLRGPDPAAAARRQRQAARRQAPRSAPTRRCGRGADRPGHRGAQRPGPGAHPRRVGDGRAHALPAPAGHRSAPRPRRSGRSWPARAAAPGRPATTGR